MCENFAGSAFAGAQRSFHQACPGSGGVLTGEMHPAPAGVRQQFWPQRRRAGRQRPHQVVSVQHELGAALDHGPRVTRHQLLRPHAAADPVPGLQHHHLVTSPGYPVRGQQAGEPGTCHDHPHTRSPPARGLLAPRDRLRQARASQGAARSRSKLSGARNVAIMS
jgi:hypothetical protein